MNEEFVEFDGNEVISLEELKYAITLNHPTFKVCELAEAFKKPLGSAIFQNKSGAPSDLVNNWLENGVKCQILKPGAKDWQPGKVRIKISLEFCPEQPEIEEELPSDRAEFNQLESPLDDLRKMLNENS